MGRPVNSDDGSKEAGLPREVIVLRTNWKGIGLLAVAGTAVITAISVAHRFGPSPFEPVVVLGIFATLLITGWIVHRAPMRFERVPFEITTAGIRVGNTDVERSRLENAYVRPPGSLAQQTMLLPELRRPRVVLSGKKHVDSMLLAVTSEEEGQRIVEAIALDPTTTVSTFRVRGGFSESRAVDKALMFMGVLSGWSLYLTHWPRVLPAALIAVAALNVFLPKRIRIGADGVHVTSPGRRKYVPFSAIESVEEAMTGFVIVSSSGQRVSIQADRFSGDGARMRKQAIVARIRSGLAAAREGRADVQLVLERGALSTVDWLAKLRDLSARTEYRIAALDRTDLWRVLEDTTATPEARVGAAAALRVGGHEREKARLRVAIEASASPELRAAIVAAANEDADALERALTALESG